MGRRVDPPPDGLLFQEWIDDPFWMLVACQLVNLTTWKQARPAFDWIRSTCRAPINLALATPEDLEDVLRPLGLWRRRAVILPRFARAWLQRKPATAEEVMKLPGCGKYASDSWAIFVEGRHDVEPNDGKLNWYVDRRQDDQRIQDDRAVQPGSVRPQTPIPEDARPREVAVVRYRGARGVGRAA